MAVTRPWSAREAVRLLVGSQQVPLRRILAEPYLPAPLAPGDGSPLRLGPDDLIGGYGDENRFVFAGGHGPLIAGPAEEAMSTDEGLTDYVTSSLDLTMQGGTTSGVVYPLAACELATRFRFRNVGGASAGAIAAAFTAAAEVGRSEAARDRVLLAPAAPVAPVGPALRRGFTGLADVMAWLTQTGSVDGGADQFRLAQLFRPGPGTHAMFRVVIATMRGRRWPLPLLALVALGPRTLVVTAALILITLAGIGWVGAALDGGGSFWGALGWGALCWVGFVVTLVAAVLVGQLVGSGLRRQRRRAEQRSTRGTPLGLLGDVTSGAPPRPDRYFLATLIVAPVLVGLVGWLAVVEPLRYLAAWIVGLAGSFAVIAILVAGVVGYVGRFKDEAYGLVAGTEPPRRRNWLDRLAKAPAPTVSLSLVPWLGHGLSQLAGLPVNEVLRFGHLWDGAAYRPPTAGRTPDDLARWERQARVKDARLVNLELMTTDLTRRRPYRFPLALDDLAREPLYLRLDRLRAAGVFPEEVLAALGETTPVRARTEDGTDLVDLHPLPAPWDLPVVVAVRLSMALPALFEAVPFYRLRGEEVVRDDLGRTVELAGTPLTEVTVRLPLPAPGTPLLTPDVPMAQELWFSDGGITSNFPVHFFDAALPRWPTVSLNLGAHPEAAPMQDVSLPTDWDVAATLVEPLGRSGLALPAAILDTAMSWRDSMQSALPGYRNRIAQVRSRPDEGGVNLFMTRDAIASLGLRGALAGARLRTRFSDPAEWDRFRWLRLRVALSNLETLRADTDRRRPFYADALATADWLTSAEQRFLAGQPAQPDATWWQPGTGFWPGARTFLQAFGASHQPTEPDPLTSGTPRPEPALRQVPQE